MADSIKKALIAKRAGLHAHFTRTLSQASDELAKDTESDLDLLVKYKEKLHEFQKRIESLDQDIFELCEQTELDDEVAPTTDLTAQMTDCMIDLDNLHT